MHKNCLFVKRSGLINDLLSNCTGFYRIIIHYDVYGEDIANQYLLACFHGTELEHCVIKRIYGSFIFGHVVIVLN